MNIHIDIIQSSFHLLYGFIFNFSKISNSKSVNFYHHIYLYTVPIFVSKLNHKIRIYVRPISNAYIYSSDAKDLINLVK